MSGGSDAGPENKALLDYSEIDRMKAEFDSGDWPRKPLPSERHATPSKPYANARPQDAPNYATVDERGVESPVPVGRGANPPAEPD